MGLFNFRNKNKGKNFKYLDDLIKSGKKHIVLESDIVFNDKKSDFFNGIIIEEDDVVIDGNGHVIDAKRKVPIIAVTGNNVHLKNIIFKNGISEIDQASAVTVAKNSSLLISECQFTGNVSSSRYALINYSNLKIENTLFNDNLGREGSAINNQGNLTINNCEFKDNKSQTMGTIFNWNRVEIQNSIFENNKARDGGAIYSTEGSLNIKNSRFINNSVSGKKEGGGAIINEYKSKLSIDSCDFIENKSKINYGGAIRNYGDGKISNSLFANNLAFNAMAIFNDETAKLTVSNSDFNPSHDEIIINYGVLDLTDLTSANFSPLNKSNILNMASIDLCDKELRGIIHNKGRINEQELNKVSNSSEECNFTYLKQLIQNSGNEVNLNSDIILDDDEISDFKEGILIDTIDKVINGNGHVIDAKSKSSIFKVKGDVVFKDITFKNGFSKDYAGAIYNSYNSSSTFENCIFKANAGENAGAIYNEGLLNFIDCEFEDNVSQKNGGVVNTSSSQVNDDAIYDKNILEYKDIRSDLFDIDVNLKFMNCTFVNNSSKSRGGVLSHLVNGSIIFDNCDFLDNSSLEGGSIYNSFASISIISCTFDETVGTHGGVVYMLSGSLNIEDSSMIKSTAQNGACIYNHNASIKINSSIFEENYANNVGGCIFNVCSFNNTVEIHSSNFENNSAEVAAAIMNTPYTTLDEAGQQLINNEGKMNLSSCIFENNESINGSGGAICHFSGLLDATDCKFENNSSNTGGGAIATIRASMNLKDSIFEKNKSLNEGGAIYNQTSSVDILNCEFIDNYPEKEGVLATIDASSYFNINRCLFKDSDPNNNKIAISNDGGQIDIKESNFDDIPNIFNKGTIKISKTDEEYFKNIIKSGNITFI